MEYLQQVTQDAVLSVEFDIRDPEQVVESTISLPSQTDFDLKVIPMPGTNSREHPIDPFREGVIITSERTTDKPTVVKFSIKALIGAGVVTASARNSYSVALVFGDGKFKSVSQLVSFVQVP
jgi:hypothetical protein